LCPGLANAFCCKPTADKRLLFANDPIGIDHWGPRSSLGRSGSDRGLFGGGWGRDSGEQCCSEGRTNDCRHETPPNGAEPFHYPTFRRLRQRVFRRAS
jgi:hypothetical protein